MSKELNARPARALNQRPGTASKTMPQSKYPAPNMAKAPQAVPKAPMPGMQKPAAQAPAKIAAVSGQTKSSAPAAKTSSNSSVSSFVGVMRSMVSPFAILSDEVIQKNLDLASGKGMSNDDRTVSFECADYLMSNLAYIFMGLVLDAEFKDSFIQAILVETKLDEQDEAAKAKVRETMKDTHEYKSAGAIVIGVTTFVSSIVNDLMNKMQDSFDALDDFTDEFDKAVDALSEDQRIEYGFIFSNFMYLIRAFTHNDMFLSYVITVIEGVKDKIKGAKK